MSISHSTQAFLFDLDGVVIDSEHARDEITRTLLLSTFGITYERDLLKPQMSGKSSVACMEVLVRHYGLSCSATELDTLRRDAVLLAYRETIPFVPGFLDFYQNLRAGFPHAKYGIVTGCDHKYFEAIDSRLGLSELFDHHVYRSDDPLFTGQPKPAPDLIVYAAQNLGATPEHCTVFEDAPNGIAAALRAGSYVVALTRTFSEEVLRREMVNIVGKDYPVQALQFIFQYSDFSRF